VKPTTGIVAIALAISSCASQAPVSKTANDPRSEAIASEQRYLAGEYAAIWGYGRAAALLPKAQLGPALLKLEAHRKERDRLVSKLLAAGVEPVGSLAAYDEGAPIDNAREARTFLSLLESRLSALRLAAKDIPSKT